MNTYFSTLLNGEDRALIITENNNFIAFLESKPLTRGHTIVIPKIKTDHWLDLSDEELGEMIVFAKKIAQHLKNHFPCQKIGLSILGLEVRHAHLHLVPISSAQDLNFTASRLSPSREELETIAKVLMKDDFLA